MRSVKKYLLIIALALALSASASFASPEGFQETARSMLSLWTPQIDGSLVSVNPSSWGGELGVSFLVPPIPDRGLWVGPRLGVMWAGGNSQSRFDFQLGAEAILWMANAIGPGIELDWIGPSTVFSNGNSNGNPVHFRVSPNFSVRFSRFKDDGAWAMRFGLAYDTLYQWGVSLGVSLQWSGVSRIGEPI